MASESGSGSSGAGLDIRILDRGDHTWVEYKDIINYENQMRLVDLIFGMYSEQGKQKFIIDTRGCVVNYSILDRYKVAEYIAEKWRWNIVCAYIIDRQNNTGIVENVSQNRGGVGLKVVSDEKAALDWVAGETPGA